MTNYSTNETGAVMDTTTGHEKRLEPKVFFLGTLADFNVGNPNGIPSDLESASPEELTAYGEKAKQALTKVTDNEHYSCIDGRKKLRNADGSKPAVRHSQVSGVGAVYAIALNADASIIDTLADNDLPQQITTIENDYEAKTGIKRSAHLGICGGVFGEADDQKAIATNPAVLTLTETLMGLPEVQAFNGIAFNHDSGVKVTENAVFTEATLKKSGWDGAKYIEGVVEDEPAGVEELETANDKFHGHMERALWIVVSEEENLSPEKFEELGLGQAFVWSLKASRDMANALAGQRGEQGATQALIANYAKHVAVADRLPKDTTPVFLMVA